MSAKVDAAIDALVDALAELPERELEFWQRGNRVSVVLYELNRRYPALAQATSPGSAQVVLSALVPLNAAASGRQDGA